MPQFRKKPVTIEAFLWKGLIIDLLIWAANAHAAHHKAAHEPEQIAELPLTLNESGELEITTLEGVHRANVGDWIICGVKGEFYPCKPDIFALTYEPVTPVHKEGEAT